MEAYGISLLSIVPVRHEPSDKSEQVTQLLFGETFLILEENPNQKWLRIEIAADKYIGWIDKLQATNISKEFFQEVNVQKMYFICAEPMFTINWENSIFHIPRGGVLPLYDGKSFQIENAKIPFGGKVYRNETRNIETLVEIAKSYLAIPYLWGGKSFFGIDCSGFVQQVFKSIGYQLPRDAHQQAEIGTMIESLAQSKAGDLAFFVRDEKIVHVGIILDNNQIIHARGKVGIDKIDEKGIWIADVQMYSHILSHIRRISID